MYVYICIYVQYFSVAINSFTYQQPKKLCRPFVLYSFPIILVRSYFYHVFFSKFKLWYLTFSSAYEPPLLPQFDCLYSFEHV